MRDKAAFPIQTTIVFQHGLTKREYFAAKALQGSLAAETTDWQHSPEKHAQTAVACADALIEALEKQP